MKRIKRQTATSLKKHIRALERHEENLAWALRQGYKPSIARYDDIVAWYSRDSFKVINGGNDFLARKSRAQLKLIKAM
jgi:hypothetical protein